MEKPNELDECKCCNRCVQWNDGHYMWRCMDSKCDCHASPTSHLSLREKFIQNYLPFFQNEKYHNPLKINEENRTEGENIFLNKNLDRQAVIKANNVADFFLSSFSASVEVMIDKLARLSKEPIPDELPWNELTEVGKIGKSYKNGFNAGIDLAISMCRELLVNLK